MCNYFPITLGEPIGIPGAKLRKIRVTSKLSPGNFMDFPAAAGQANLEKSAFCMSPWLAKARWNSKAASVTSGVWPPRPILR